MSVLPGEEQAGPPTAGGSQTPPTGPPGVEPSASSAADAVAALRREAAERAARLRPSREARERLRNQQAIAMYRRPMRAWTTTTVLAAAVAVVAVLIGLAGVGGLLLRLGAPLALPAAAPVAERPVPTEIPTVEPAPRPTPEILDGPEISVGMVEANGPVATCALHERFNDLGSRIGLAMVGHCVEDPKPAPTGDVRQRTVHGELFWFAVDSRAAFTDGAHVWTTGPDGIVRRRIEERFAWERDADAGPRPTSNTHVLPPALPGAVLPAKRIVSYYGNPLSSGMGILGELPPEKLFPRLKQQADGYRSADRSRQVVPALELVAVVAQAEPGADGLHRLRMDTELIEKVSAWAEEQGFLLILDVQIGWGKVDDEVAWLLPFLKRPHVHLALDPEFAMPRSQKPGERIGTMDAAAINGAMRTLSKLVEQENLPPKLLIVHRFTEEMVTNYKRIQTDPRVQVVMVMDGFGGPHIKTRQYDELIVEQRVQYTGFKLFYRHDEPLMTPDQVLLLDPAPDVVIYQ
ncbi:MAG: hypothetical protein IT306_20145 [Chloroflexi bacterium]|nr:hypothetical protein [Chloroflexota bacterium]